MNSKKINQNLLKILLITGKKSLKEISNIADKINHKKRIDITCDVMDIDISVSAFISREQVIDKFKKLKDKNYDLALLPGFIPWDTEILKNKFKIPFYKGTKFSGDLYDLLLNIRDLELSTSKAADLIIQKNVHKEIEKYKKTLINDFKDSKSKKIKDGFKFSTKNNTKTNTETKNKNINRYVGSKFPPLLFAEIVNAPKLEFPTIFEKIEYYIESGADVIDIGTIIGKNNELFIRELVESIKKKYNILVSIDSVDINEIIAGIESGADIILSIDESNYDLFANYCSKNKVSKEIGIVIIPLGKPNHKFIDDSNRIMEILLKIARSLKNLGFYKIFYDPLLKTPISPGFIPSLELYIKFSRILEEENESLNYPLFMGFNNVFELIDSDSQGINTLLSLIAMELNVGGILTTEYSSKSLGAISETKRSIELGYLAKIRNSPPINLGITAFSAKNKKKSNKRDIHPKNIINLIEKSKTFIKSGRLKKIIENKFKLVHDKNGYFEIFVNHQQNQIEVIFFPFEEFGERNNLTENILIIGKNGSDIYKEIYKMELIEELSHAMYIGYELGKAEYALNINASYNEDTDIFR